MKFKLNIDKNKEELVEATLHRKGDFSYKLEEMVLGYSGEDSITAYTEDDIKVLKFSEIECVTVDGSKTYAVDVLGKRYRLKMRLYEISEILPSYFIRINKSSLANKKTNRKVLGGILRFGRRCFQERLQGLCFEKMLCRYQKGVEVR